MSSTPREQLLRQVDRVRRRLFLQTLGRRLILCSAICLLFYAGVLLFLGVRSEAWALDSSVFLDRLGQVGLGALLAAAIALASAWTLRPSLTDAALSLDDQYQLQQRVTTALTLGAAEEDSEAGQALLADAGRRATELPLRNVYSLRPSLWSIALVPVSASVFLAMLFCKDWPTPPDPDSEPVSPELKAELEETSKRLREMVPPKTDKGEKAPRGDEFQKIAAEIERLAGQQPKTKAEAREVIKDMTTLEDRMRKLEQGLAERADALQKQAEEADRLAKKKPDAKPTPQDQAMKDGDFQRAAEELKHLTREMEKGDMTPEQRQQFDRQLSNMKEHLDRLADMKEKQAKDRESGLQDKLDREQLEELKKLEAADLADLKDAVRDLQDAEKALKESKEQEAMQKLADAAEKMGRLDPKGDQAALAKQLAMLQAMKEKLGRNMGGAGPGAGKRPDKPQEDLKGTETQAKGKRSPGGLSGFRLVPGTGLREPKSADELRGLIDEAGRAAAEAAQRQRLPRADVELTRGFYKKLRGEQGK